MAPSPLRNESRATTNPGDGWKPNETFPKDSRSISGCPPFDIATKANVSMEFVPGCPLPAKNDEILGQIGRRDNQQERSTNKPGDEERGATIDVSPQQLRVVVEQVLFSLAVGIKEISRLLK